MTEPLNNDDIDRIFGMSSPDFTGNDDHGPAKPGEIVECCQRHFLQWLVGIFTSGQVASLSPKDQAKAAAHLDGVLEYLQETTGGVQEEFAQVLESMGLGALGKVLQGIVMEARYDKAGKLPALQVLTSGARIFDRNGRSIKVSGEDAVFLAGTVAGWIKGMTGTEKMFAKAFREMLEAKNNALGEGGAA
jgi:hypothetical protein